MKVKVETFNFTRYGLIEGRVRGRQPRRDRAAATGQSAAMPPTGAPAGSGAAAATAPTYVARIALSKTSMMVDGRLEPLQPGMSVTADIRTGSRSIIDYLLSPIARKTQESLHER